MQPIIQLATLQQIELILPMVRAYHDFEQIESTESMRESAVRGLITDNALGGIWLIYCGNEPVGHIALCKGYSIEFGGFDAFVDEFYIVPEFRGKGIGRKVLELIKTEAKKMDIQALHLEVARENHPARTLYSSAEFEARKKYVLMSVTLS